MYKTNSLQVASYLYSQKELTFKGINKENPEKISFMFEPRDKAEEYTDEYFSGNATVDPLELFQNLKTLKDMVFEVKRNTRT
jgi:hypothetical protein